MVRKILIVEDDKSNRTFLETFLRRMDYDVLTFTNASETLDYLTENALPDAILVDLFLPGMNGMELAITLKSDDATTDIPLIAISASPETLGYANLYDAGFLAVLLKPVLITDLKAKLDEIFQKT